MSIKPLTVADYLAAVDPPRRVELATVLNVIRKHLPAGYVETIAFGMIAYELPLAVYPNTYNKKPLMFAALAAQKNHLALYLNCFEQDAARTATLEKAFAGIGKKADMGKSCLRFQAATDLPLDALGGLLAGVPPSAFVELYEAARRKSGKG